MRPSGGVSYDGLAGTNTLFVKGSTGAETVSFNSLSFAAINGLSINMTNTNAFHFRKMLFGAASSPSRAGNRAAFLPSPPLTS